MLIIPNWHPVFVHFTIALICTSFLFMLLSWVLPGHKLIDQWRVAARWMLWAGGAFTLFTLLSGWHAFNTVAHDDVSHRIMREHRNLALATSAVLLVLVVWAIKCCARGRPMGYGFLAAMTLLVFMVLYTGWYGAELVYRHGVGVMNLPVTTDHHHEGQVLENHGHDQGADTHSGFDTHGGDKDSGGDRHNDHPHP